LHLVVVLHNKEERLIMGLFDRFTNKKKREEEARKLEYEARRQSLLAAETEKVAEAEKKRKAEERQAKKQAKKVAEETEKKNGPKEQATLAGEPWITVLSVDIDPDDPGAGAFELDWNDIFVARLVKAGYQGKNDQDIVDNWFKTICRNVIQENFEQVQADPELRASNRKDLGNGRTEVS